ncbi:MAG: hypothetical protein M3O02_01280 [Acidobacteriota bacterium]|nr:hypothetical protein [Acidobacteriota bacterium]
MKTIVAGALFAGLTLSAAANAQRDEGLVATQVLVAAEGKAPAALGRADLTVTVEGRTVPLDSWTAVAPARAQVALLIDDGLRESVGRNISAIKSFLNGLPQGVEVLVGYMQNGRVVAAQPFTADHAAAAAAIRLPQGVPGESASPYFCLSDFVKHWPGAAVADPNAPPELQRERTRSKSRFVLMITNGVDPYNGSTSLANQDSPYVAAASTDAKRAGVAVYAIYYGDAGIGGPGASLSGQSYLEELTHATGGKSFYQGAGNPVALDPFLKQFTQALGATYVAEFQAPAGKSGHDLVRLKVSSASKAKLRAPDEVRPGNRE